MNNRISLYLTEEETVWLLNLLKHVQYDEDNSPDDLFIISALVAKLGLVATEHEIEQP